MIDAEMWLLCSNIFLRGIESGNLAGAISREKRPPNGLRDLLGKDVAGLPEHFRPLKNLISWKL